MSDDAPEYACEVCGAEQSPSAYGPGCTACAGAFRARMHGVRDLVDLLLDVVAKTARVERVGGRGGFDVERTPEVFGLDRHGTPHLLPLTAAASPAPVDLDALEARRAVVALVLGAADRLEADRGLRRDEAADRWLADKASVLRLLPWFPELHLDLERATRRGWSLVDAPPPSGWFAGDCDAVLDAPSDPGYGASRGVPGVAFVCGRKLYARLDEQRVRCRGCGTWHEVAPRRAVLLKAAEDTLMTANETARVVVTLGLVESVDKAAARFRQWRTRELLEVRAYTVEGRPRYRLGDVLVRLRLEAFGVTSATVGRAS